MSLCLPQSPLLLGLLSFCQKKTRDLFYLQYLLVEAKGLYFLKMKIFFSTDHVIFSLILPSFQINVFK